MLRSTVQQLGYLADTDNQAMNRSQVVPRSKVRKKAAAKATQKRRSEEAAHIKEKMTPVQNRDWVPWVFIPLGLLGVAWLVVYYIAGDMIPFMTDLGDKNLLIGLALMGSAFIVSTFWK